MLPPPELINYSEMRIQKVQIPVQVPIFKPIYVDYPYPNYVWTQDTNQAAFLRTQQGIQSLLTNPQIKKQLIYDSSSEESESSSENESESESDEVQKVQTQENRQVVQNQQQFINNDINTQNQVNGAQIQQNINTNQYIEYGQNQQPRPPIQLDYHDSGYQKTQFQINNSYVTNQYPLQNIIQGKNDTTVSKNISMGRQHLEKFKSQMNQNNLINQRQSQNQYPNTFIQ
ncbi:unnamed protein product [Paramecium pentaurelia]|uniref:Uncharacterized protein n=1 Tax=Paramecium pentaurelia TaxID=43138 RepID=A0A8S1VUS6_9CILI|nr:unnamed protein product [Paramecium pentaurelia]